MDVNGARDLAKRLRAGVWIGMRVELVADFDEASGLTAGDRGVVDRIDDQGNVVVSWDRGFTLEIDPERTQVRPLAA
jgi:Domain of unknown function (DUF4314)